MRDLCKQWIILLRLVAMNEMADAQLQFRAVADDKVSAMGIASVVDDHKTNRKCSAIAQNAVAADRIARVNAFLHMLQ